VDLLAGKHIIIAGAAAGIGAACARCFAREGASLTTRIQVLLVLSWHAPGCAVPSHKGIPLCLRCD